MDPIYRGTLYGRILVAVSAFSPADWCMWMAVLVNILLTVAAVGGSGAYHPIVYQTIIQQIGEHIHKRD